MSNLTPTPKVTAGAAGGALAVVAMWVLRAAGLDPPAEVAAAATTLASFAAGWLRKDG